MVQCPLNTPLSQTYLIFVKIEVYTLRSVVELVQVAFDSELAVTVDLPLLPGGWRLFGLELGHLARYQGAGYDPALPKETDISASKSELS